MASKSERRKEIRIEIRKVIFRKRNRLKQI